MATFAAVDIGANSVRLKIARVVRKRLEVLHEDREVVRLGEGVFRTGSLDPSAIDQTIRVLKRFHRAAQTYGATKVRVAATSALRDANNSAAFMQWVHAATGWRIEVISGLEEGRLIHLGVLANTRIRAGRMLLIDLGGGSCELIVSYKGQIERIYSLPLGAVRLTREFLKHDPPKKGELQQLRAYIGEEIGRIKRELTEHRIDITVATSGTPAALSGLFAAQQGTRTTTVPRAALSRIAKRISSLNVEQRRALKGIGPRRAEIIVAGAELFNELFSALHLPSFRYLPYGLRDGLLLQMASEEEDIGVRKRLDSERANSVMNMAAHYQIDSRFASRVREHCERLFKQLANVHHLPAETIAVLNAAAMLHEVGSFINRAGRRRHAYYILSHSELLGFTPAQRRMIAAIARYVGKSKITQESGPMRALTVANRILLPRAVMLLRLARALEQGRRGAVEDLRARVTNVSVTLSLRTKASGAELEMWALEKEKNYFRDVFGRELVVSADV